MYNEPPEVHIATSSAIYRSRTIIVNTASEIMQMKPEILTKTLSQTLESQIITITRNGLSLLNKF